MKVELKEVNASNQDSVEIAYQEIIAQDQEQNKDRANTALSILPDAAKQNIMESCKYSSYFPNPITKPFMRKYILAKIEFPTKGSELSQSLTELNVRIDNLFSDAYSFEKAKIEAEGSDLDIEKLNIEMEILKLGENPDQEKIIKCLDLLRNNEISQKQNQISLKGLEKSNKLHSLNKTKLAALARYNEAMGWKGCVEDIMGEMGVKTLDEVDFNSVRMDEMAAKVRKWGELQANQMLEMTPSKLNVILDSQDDFQKGLYKGSLAVELGNFKGKLPQLEHDIAELESEISKAPTSEQEQSSKVQLAEMKQEAQGIRFTISQIENAQAKLDAEENQKSGMKLLK